MEINDALYSYLSTYAGLSALISTRIYPDILPQSPTVPAITYQSISKVREHLFRADSTLVKSRYQFSCFGNTRSSSKAVAKQIRFALQNYSGTMGGTGGVIVNAVEIDGEDDNYESDTKLYSTMLDFLIWHEE